MKIAAIINPQSGGGKTIKVWREYGERLSRKLGGLSVLFTERAHHATELARHVATQGYDKLIVVGGDGTLHEVVNGFFDNGKPLYKKDFSMAILNGGRGCDFVKTLGLGDDAEEMFKVALASKTKKVDIGHVETEKGGLYFINSSTFGLGGEVARSVQGGSAFLPPTASYLAATVKSVVQAKPKEISLKVDGLDIYRGPAHNVFVCNGRYSGGGMLWAPKAQLDDGLLDVLLIRDLTRVQLLTLAPRLYTGSISHVSGISLYTAKTCEVTSTHKRWLELDGETYYTSFARYSILHNVLPLHIK